MSDRREICHRKCHTNRDSGGAVIVSDVYGNNLASDLPPVSGTDASSAHSQTSAEPARSCNPAVSALSRNSATENATPAPRPLGEVRVTLTVAWPDHPRSPRVPEECIERVLAALQQRRTLPDDAVVRGFMEFRLLDARALKRSEARRRRLAKRGVL